MKTISIAKDYSTVPAGRFHSDGDHSGEGFRDNLLAPALKEHQQVVVDFDGTEGYGSSFLEEAFGGLVRIHGYTREQLHDRLKLVSEEDESIPEEVWGYIDTAVPTK